MTHHTEQVGFPNVPIQDGMKVRIRTISETTGVAVTGNIATEWAIYGRAVSGAAGALSDEVPRYLPVDEDG